MKCDNNWNCESGVFANLLEDVQSGVSSLRHSDTVELDIFTP